MNTVATSFTGREPNDRKTLVTDPFSNVLWIGGSPCTGKSTIADHLAAETGAHVYRCDDAYFHHQDLTTAERQPVFHRLARANCDEVWMRPVPRQIDEALALYREEFSFILADLAAFEETTPVIVEGAALLPELVAALGVPTHRALWLVPTEPFQREHYARRQWRHEVLASCADPDQAWENWMARDAGFARFVAADATTRGFRALTVDGTRSLADMVRLAESWLRG